MLHDPDADPVREEIAEQTLRSSPDARASSSPPTTVAISSATSIQRCRVEPPVRASMITSSMMSFATQSFVTGTTERDETQHDHRHRVAAMRLPHEPDETRHEPHRGDAVLERWSRRCRVAHAARDDDWVGHAQSYWPCVSGDRSSLAPCT